MTPSSDGYESGFDFFFFLRVHLDVQFDIPNDSIWHHPKNDAISIV